jgi:hypothetical protein
MKYAIYINDGATGQRKLFALAKDYFYVSRLRYLARKTLPEFCSDWVTVKQWTYSGQFMDQYEWAHYSAGPLF